MKTKKDRTRICKKHPGTERVMISGFGTRCKICYENAFMARRNKNIDKATKIHNGEYDYSLVHFGSIIDKVRIICHKHGIFEQHIGNHLKGEKCPSCRKEEKTRSLEEVVKKFIEVHGDIYNYSLVKYKNNKTNVDIICKKHGVFSQKPEKHLIGQGCPNCRLSHGECLIRNLLENKEVGYESQKKFIECINIDTGKNLKFDFYLPSLNACIEYDGEQHFEPRFSKKEKSVIGFKKVLKNDAIKNKFCNDSGIKLLRISYLEKKDIDKIVEIELLKWQKEKDK